MINLVQQNTAARSIKKTNDANNNPKTAIQRSASLEEPAPSSSPPSKVSVSRIALPLHTNIIDVLSPPNSPLSAITHDQEHIHTCSNRTAFTWQDTNQERRMTPPVSAVSIATPLAPHTVNHHVYLQNSNYCQEKPLGQEPSECKISECFRDADICGDNVDATVPADSIQHKLLQLLRYKLNTCSDLDDEYEEMDQWMTVCPKDNDTTHKKTTPTQQNNNNGNCDGSGNNQNNRSSGGGGNGSQSAFNGSKEKDDDDDDDKESKSDPETDNDGDEDDETNRFIYFLMHQIVNCDDVKLREELSSFSPVSIGKVLLGIQDLNDQRLRISKIMNQNAKHQKKGKMQHNKTQMMDFRLQIKSQYQMHQTFTSNVIPLKVQISAIDPDLDVDVQTGLVYDYIIKLLSINKDNCYADRDTMQIFNLGLRLTHSAQDAYFIAQRQRRDRRGHDWLVEKVLSATEICTEYNHIKPNDLPTPIDISHEMKQMEEQIMKLKTQSNVLEDTKWNKIHIYNKRNNKRRMQLMYTNHEFKAHCRHFIARTDEEEITMLPIVMFDRDDNACIQYVMIVSIEEDVDIGIAFKSPFTVVGIHLNKDLIYKQHQVLCMSQPCRHLSRFKSCINYMHIGNCDDALNAKKGLQKQNKALQETNHKLQMKVDAMMRSPSTSCDSPFTCFNSPVNNHTPIIQLPKYSLSNIPDTPSQVALSPINHEQAIRNNKRQSAIMHPVNPSDEFPDQ